MATSFPDRVQRREYLIGTVLTILFAAANAARVGPFTFGLAEVLGFITGAWGVWLAVRNSKWTWPVGISNAFIFIYLFADAKLFADAALNGWYVLAGIYGWWYWMRGGAHRTERPVGHVSLRETAAIVTAVGLVTWWMSGHLRALGDPAPWLDGLTATASMAAFWLQSRRVVESWYVWIFVDLIYIPLYISRDLVLTGALYVVFLGMCIVGLREWRRLAAEQALPPTQSELPTALAGAA